MDQTGFLHCITVTAPVVGDTASIFFFFLLCTSHSFLGIFHAGLFELCKNQISPQIDSCVWYVVIHTEDRKWWHMTQVTGNGSQVGSYSWDSNERKEASSVEWALRVEVRTLVPRAPFFVAGTVLACGTAGMRKASTLRPWSAVVSADVHCFCVSPEKPVALSEPAYLSSEQKGWSRL